MKINTATSALTALNLLAVTSASQAVVVYQDNFDGDFGNPLGVGGDFISDTNITAAGEFIDQGELTSQTNFGNRIAYMHSVNQFDLTGGFTLTVSFTTATVVDSFPSFSSTFGVIDEITASGSSTGNLNSFLKSEQDVNAVGLSLVAPAGVNADFGVFGNASTALDSAIALGTTQTFSMTVDTDGSASFDLDGTMGSVSAGTFSDLFANSADGEFYFAAYSQGNPGLTLHEVTIETVPEPSSTALLGLGGLALILRRRM